MEKVYQVSLLIIVVPNNLPSSMMKSKFIRIYWGERERAPLPPPSAVNGDFVRAYGCMVLYIANTSNTYFNGMPSLTLAPQCSAFTNCYVLYMHVYRLALWALNEGNNMVVHIPSHKHVHVVPLKSHSPLPLHVSHWKCQYAF